MKVKLTRITQNPVQAIEEAASNCYDSEIADGRIMRACYNSGHHSVLEFADFTFHVEGVSRALLAQLSRHRFCSFAVRSQRYCDENNFKYVVPHSFEHNHDAMLEYVRAMEKILETYKYLQSIGIPNEDARYVLPNACETILEIKMNGRELIHVFNERGCTRAQWEIRELAIEMLKQLKQVAPILFKNMGPNCVQGPCPEGNMTCGKIVKIREKFKNL